MNRKLRTMTYACVWAVRGKWLAAPVLLLLMGFSVAANAQQFSSDNYWTAPHGTETSIATIGQNYSLLLGVVSLFPRWEFNIGATLFRDDGSTDSTSHYSATAYVKHMFYENEAKTGGWAVMAGTGVVPGYFQAGTITSDARSYWAYFPLTLPFFDNTLSWDIMPGITSNKGYVNGVTDGFQTGFSYNSRLAIYKIVPQSAIVGEVFGSTGNAYADPQYKVGVRWEGKTVVAALTYGDTFNHSPGGAGFEFGIMIFSPQFLCFGGCEK